MHVEGARVEYRRGALTEWYENRVDGLEQGFTVHRRPGEPEPGQPLRVWLTLEGLTAETPSDPVRDELVQTAFTRSQAIEGVDYGLLVTTDLLTVPFSFRFLPDTDPDPEAFLFSTETGTNRCLFATIVVWETEE